VASKLTHVNWAFATISYSAKQDMYYVDTPDAWADMGSYPEKECMPIAGATCGQAEINLAPYIGAPSEQSWACNGDCYNAAFDAQVPNGGNPRKPPCNANLGANTKGGGKQPAACGMYNKLLNKRTGVRAKYPHLRYILSVGGWYDSNFFTPATNTTYRAKFIKSIVTFVQAFDWDGIDFDWEYPGYEHGDEPLPGKEKNGISPEDVINCGDSHPNGTVITDVATLAGFVPQYARAARTNRQSDMFNASVGVSCSTAWSQCKATADCCGDCSCSGGSCHPSQPGAGSCGTGPKPPLPTPAGPPPPAPTPPTPAGPTPPPAPTPPPPPMKCQEPSRVHDGKNYGAFLVDLKAALKVAQIKSGRTEAYTISIAGAGGQDKTAKQDLKTMCSALDWVNIMTYDMHGSWDKTTNHQSPMKCKGNMSAHKPFCYSVENIVEYYLANGCSADQLHIGVPFYGHRYDRVAQGNDTAVPGLYQAYSNKGINCKTDGGCPPTYVDNKEYWAAHTQWDEESQATYAYDANTSKFFSFDDERSIAAKAAYLKSKKLGGFMYWYVGGDSTNNTLLTAMHNGLQ
jgi:GH18 family chitinase